MMSIRRHVLLAAALLAACDSQERDLAAPPTEQPSVMSSAATFTLTNVTATLGDYAEAVIDWTPPASPSPVSVTIERKVRDFGGTGKWEAMDDPATAYYKRYERPRRNGPLRADKIYAYRLRACYEGECAPLVVTNEVTLPGLAPVSPSEVQAAQTRYGSVAINGTARRGDDRFFMLVTRDRNEDSTYTTWRDVRRSSYGEPAYFYEQYCTPRPGGCLPNLEPGETYYWGIRSCSASGGCSAPTAANPVTVYESRPSMVTALTGSAASPSHINLSWTEAQRVVKYKLSRRHRLGDGTLSAWQTLASPSAGVTSFADGSVSPDMVYQYQIRSCNGYGCSDPTLSPKVKTPIS
jgi:hypothetical protein